jgi:glycosyltransferase involved in cell wall biosynthesis
MTVLTSTKVDMIWSLKKIIVYCLRFPRRVSENIVVGFADFWGFVAIARYRAVKRLGYQNAHNIISHENRPRCLILRYGKYGNDLDTSFEYDQIDLPLKESGYETTTYVWDGNLISRHNLLESVLQLNPDLIVLSSYVMIGRRIKNQPSIGFFAALKPFVPNAKFVCLWWDTCSNRFWSKFPLENVFDLHVAMENPCGMSLDITRHVRQKFLFLYSTHPRLSVIRPKEKDISVFFSGQIGDYRSNRKEYVDYLLKNGFGRHIYTNDRATQISKKDYFEIMGRARMVVNFSMSVDFHQLKGRVFEAIFAKCLLLESRNPQIECFFRDGEHYIAYDSKEDLLDKILYFGKNPAEAERIAQNARDLVLKEFTTENFWKSVHDFLGIKMPSRVDQKPLQSCLPPPHRPCC